MATPAPTPVHIRTEIPCCSPATTESVAVVRDKVADARADILVGQGAILRGQGDSTSAILRDANANTLAINDNTDSGNYASMSQIDKFGLANLNATRAESDKVGAAVDRASYGLARDIHGESDKITGQATTIAWSQDGNEGRRFGEVRAQIERINEAQSAMNDRAFKYSDSQSADSFARLSAQGENGFYRTNTALNAGLSGVNNGINDSFARLSAQGENGFYRTNTALNTGFSAVTSGITDSYARLSEQNCDLKSAIAAAQAAAAECCCEVKQEVLRTGKELGLQAAQNFGAIQVEASKNTGAIQLQAAVNAKESLLEQSKWFALAEKTAMVNKCELEAKLAACCCEIKESVTGTASATQALIQATEAGRVRDALSAAATENAILKLRREERYVPYYPYPPYPHHGHHGHHGGGGHGGN
jgi:hypothetical protein